MTLSEKTARGNEPLSALEPQRETAGPTRGRLRSLGRRIADLGPFALIFATYSLLVDHLPNQWFSQDWVRYAFAVLAALCMGITLKWLVQRPGLQRFVGPSLAAGTMLPGAREPRPRSFVSARQIMEGTRSRLMADLRTASGTRGEVFGWSQFMGEQVPPSAIGTSYGLRIALALDLREARLDRRRLVDNVVALQRPAGGWVARSQQDVARPEVTAWVLTALVRTGLDPAIRSELVGQLERMMTPEVDGVGWQRVTVLSSAISALAEVAPASAKLDELTTHLVEGAVRQQAEGEPACMAWGMTVNHGSAPSVPHTARAVVALRKAAQAVRGDRREKLDECVDAGIEWLIRNSHYDVTDEQLRRLTSAGDAMDTIIVGHFTPAWVARALMCRAVDERRLPHLQQAVRAVLDLQENGVWKWKEERKEPTWMTYQGVLVVRDYSMLNLPWPP
ncbi:hypothetical protein ACN267_23015 [Micromonospora sp. WMMD734]|uniref:hypothetical protein n=1 Tax=Micromonospora sp. WMMD734 TaxID=3404129 RepID=UPI003B9470F7